LIRPCDFSTRTVRYSLATFSLLFISACSFQQYQAKPIDVAAIQAKYQSKDPASPEFHQFLLNNGYTQDQLPIQAWDLQALTYCALYFHPSLDTAKAQWRAAIMNESRAAEQPLPGVNLNTSKSNQANQDINPYLYSLSFDIPIETGDKRNIRLENARHLSEAAKLEIAQTAWQLRQSVAQSYYDYQHNLRQIDLASEELKRREEIVAIYQKRAELGLISNVELSAAKLLSQSQATELDNLRLNKAALLARLAQNLGLPVQQLRHMTLAYPEAANHAFTSPDQDIQTDALLNRIDIRIALERYAAAESKVKLEIARQYPDISISPGYAYEFGDKVWSLGLNSLLSLLHKNKAAIAEAEQLREVEAAQFEALQSKVISDVELARVEYQQAQAFLSRQLSLQQAHQLNSDRMQKRFSAGEIDRLELSYTKLEAITADKNVLLARYQLANALNNLENALQQPLNAQSRLNYESLSLGKSPSP
jgi:outer membrane protein, heavy metal efflux system